MDVLSGRGVPPVADAYHCREDPVAERLASVGFTTPQTVCEALAVGAGVMGETRMLSRLTVAEPELRINLMVLSDLTEVTAGVSSNT